MSELHYPEWQKPFQDALSETDKQKLQAKVHVAEWKIYQRLEQFPQIAIILRNARRLPMP
jgi:hypothetical protein